MVNGSTHALTNAIAEGLRASIEEVQARPVIVACKWCGKRSNPRADVTTAIGDLDGHMSDHVEFRDALVAAWDGDRASLADALDAYAKEAADAS